MSRQKQRRKKRSSTKQNSNQGRRTASRWLKHVFIAVAALGFAAAGLAQYKQNHDALHDLSVIGNGVPAVVQIHDPGCAMCLKLKRNVDTALRGMGGELNYRIANIHTREGRALANRHQVPHVTLLFFDGAGEVLRTTNGVIRAESLERTFRAHLAAASANSPRT